MLRRDAPAALEDKVWRAYGLLRLARALSFEEAMNLLSGVRLGVGMGVLPPELPLRTLNRLLVSGTDGPCGRRTAGLELEDDAISEWSGPRSSAALLEDEEEYPMNGYNFTDRVRKVLQMAREEAARLHHEYVGTEHILLGLIREGEGVAAAVLTNLGVDLEEIQQKIEETVKKGKGRGRRRARAALHLARQEGARARDDGSARAEPLLRRDRAPAARPPPRGEGHRRAGADRRRR